MPSDAIDRESNTPAEISPGQQCQNCGAPLTGRYCVACGQEHITRKPSLPRLFSEITANLVDADSRLWRTMFVLVLRPGRLPKDYFSGKRMSYLPPLRLYLATSLVFFMLINVNSEGSTISVEGPPPELPGTSEEALTPTEEIAIAEGADGTVSIQGSVEDCVFEYTGPWQEHVQQRLEYTCKRYKADGGEALFQEFIGYVPTAMFLMMPLFAMAMKLFYWRPKRYFMEHFLFQLFNHSAFFTVGMLGELAQLALPGLEAWLELPLFLYIVFYAYRSLQVYYEQGRKTTLFKFLVLGQVYLGLVLTGFTFAGLATVI